MPKLKPKRSRTGRRYYRDQDIHIIRRIKYLVRHEKMGLERVARRIDEEITGAGVPAGPHEAIDIIHHIEDQLRAMLDQIQSV